MRKNRKKWMAVILSIILCMSITGNVFAAEVQNSNISTRAITGYGQALNLSNASGTIPVNVTVTSGNGYGLTLKTRGTGTAIISVQRPDGVYLYLSYNYGQSVEMKNTSEKAWNFNGVLPGTYRINYTVIGGNMDIICHIYG